MAADRIMRGKSFTAVLVRHAFLRYLSQLLQNFSRIAAYPVVFVDLNDFAHQNLVLSFAVLPLLPP